MNSLSKPAVHPLFTCSICKDGAAERENKSFFHILITTYEIVLSDKTPLSKFKWEYLAVDEAHRLKNMKSQLYGVLENFQTGKTECRSPTDSCLLPRVPP